MNKVIETLHEGAPEAVSPNLHVLTGGDSSWRPLPFAVFVFMCGQSSFGQLTPVCTDLTQDNYLDVNSYVIQHLQGRVVVPLVYKLFHDEAVI